jgi:4a-hydroxytetrahydrobiopterin dehydratase
MVAGALQHESRANASLDLERTGPMNELNGMITKTKHRIENFAAQAKTAVTKAGDAVRDAAESTGGKVRDAAKSTGGKVREVAMSTGEKVRDAAKSTARKLEDAGRDVGKKMGIASAAPKVAVQKLSLAKVRGQLASIPGWKLSDGKLTREFRFANFSDALAFMTKVTNIAKEQKHDPDWTFANNVVRAQLSTHDVGGVSPLDFKLADAMNTCATGSEKAVKPPQRSKEASARGGASPARRSARPSTTRRTNHA